MRRILTKIAVRDVGNLGDTSTLATPSGVTGLAAPPDLATLSGLDRLQLPAESRVLDLAALGQYAAVRLFIERAVAVRPAFTVTNANAPAVAVKVVEFASLRTYRVPAVAVAATEVLPICTP